MTVNSSVNFIIYCIFRSVCKNIGGLIWEISNCLPVSVTNSRECWVVWSGACWEGQTWQENIRIHSLTGYMTRSIENIWNLDWALVCSPPMSWGRCQHLRCWPQGNNNKCSKNNSNIWIYINMNRHPTF